IPSTAALTGQEATDDYLTDILVNGVSTGIREQTNVFYSATPYTIGASFFHAGVNRIDFLVFNTGSGPGGPTGFRNEMSVTADLGPMDKFAVGADAGGTSTVSLFSSTGILTSTANPFPGFTGGIRTAMADMNGDGTPDLIAGTGPNTTAEVKILHGN